MYHPIGAAPMAPGPHPPPPDESETESEDGSKDASEDDLEDGSLEYLPAAPANAPQLSPGSAQAAPASAQVTLGEMTAATVLRILQEDVEERRHLAGCRLHQSSTHQQTWFQNNAYCRDLTQHDQSTY